MFSKARVFAHHVVPAVMRPLRVLWNQIIGFLFVVLGAWALPSALRSYREFDGDADSFFRIALTSIFIGLMAWFGFASFRRARKISKT